ncbi:MAG: DUF2520 domain-containing protein [Balneolia bacterium]|nr:DUF2520 domain-containing protein [Balneolia bacterium]
MSGRAPENIPCTIVGSGNVAGALAAAIQQAEGSRFYLGGVYARNVEKAASIAGETAASGRIREMKSAEGLLILAVSDDAIQEVAKLISGFDLSEELVCCHISGAAGLDTLEPLAQQGLRVGSIHPLQSFPAGANADYFRDISVSVLSPEAENLLTGFVESLNCRPVPVTEQQKKELHLAAVFASNYLVALMELVNRTTEGLSQPLSEILAPLIQTTLSNVSDKGTEQSLTGPVSRGDSGTIESHLELIRRKQDGQMMHSYKSLGRVALSLAAKSERLTPAEINEIEKLLRE